jgi:hypothetical protein
VARVLTEVNVAHVSTDVSCRYDSWSGMMLRGSNRTAGWPGKFVNLKNIFRRVMDRYLFKCARSECFANIFGNKVGKEAVNLSHYSDAYVIDQRCAPPNNMFMKERLYRLICQNTQFGSQHLIYTYKFIIIRQYKCGKICSDMSLIPKGYDGEVGCVLSIKWLTC